ncbi:MAG: hypothetical protein FWD97_03760 [Defluviitaleaceae bacterium]|nr:hypothetical protein [Defluviitaleaceae bacterium]
MKEKQKSNFLEFLRNEQDNCLAKAEKLTADGRVDEAVLQKVRANIFGIFETVTKVPDQTPETVVRLMDKIPAQWYHSLETAIRHGDFEKETLERVKITAMDEIKNYWKENF